MKLIKYIKYPTKENSNGWMPFDHTELPDTDKNIIIMTCKGEIVGGQICLLRKLAEGYFDKDNVLAFYSRDSGYFNKPDQKIDCDVLSIYPLDSIVCWKYEDWK